MKKELIKVVIKENGQFVRARELYLGLGLNRSQWSRWYKQNIQGNEFFKENQDFVGVRHNVEGNEIQDFDITIEFAKHIAMMARTEKSHEYRNYFIDCEEQLKEISNKVSEDGYIDMEELNKIRFSERRTKNTFANCDYDDVHKLVDDFSEYALSLDTKTRIARCKSAVKGLKELHDKLALLSTSNVGNCYNLINHIAVINKLKHETENHRNGGIKAGLRRKLNNINESVGA